MHERSKKTKEIIYGEQSGCVTLVIVGLMVSSMSPIALIVWENSLFPLCKCRSFWRNSTEMKRNNKWLTAPRHWLRAFVRVQILTRVLANVCVYSLTNCHMSFTDIFSKSGRIRIPNSNFRNWQLRLVYCFSAISVNRLIQLDNFKLTISNAEIQCFQLQLALFSKIPNVSSQFGRFSRTATQFTVSTYVTHKCINWKNNKTITLAMTLTLLSVK